MITIESTPIEPGARTPAQTRTFDRPEVTIGRSPRADFILFSDRISRLAIRVLLVDGALFLVDESESGSTIDGVHGWGRRPIRAGDVIEIGPYRLAISSTAPCSP